MTRETRARARKTRRPYTGQDPREFVAMCYRIQKEARPQPTPSAPPRKRRPGSAGPGGPTPPGTSSTRKRRSPRPRTPVLFSNQDAARIKEALGL